MHIYIYIGSSPSGQEGRHLEMNPLAPPQRYLMTLWSLFWNLRMGSVSQFHRCALWGYAAEVVKMGS